MSGRIRVVAAVIVEAGRVLLTRRPEGTHLAGLWEFPGGKVEPGEADERALIRELREEIDVTVRICKHYWVTSHAYPERTVELVFYRCAIEQGTPRAVEVAELAWVPLEDLHRYPLPPADAPLVEKLRQGLT